MINRKHLIICAAVIGAVVLSFAAYSKITAPSTYEECVLQHVEEAQNEQAAILIHKACRAQFPDKANYFDKYDSKPQTN